MTRRHRSLSFFALSRLLPGLLALALLQAVIGYVFVAGPLVQRSAGRFAAAVADGSAKGVVWQSLPPGAEQRSFLPFNRYFLSASRLHGAQALSVSVAPDGRYWLYWSPQRGYARFSAEEAIGARPGIALLGWIFSTLALAAMGAMLLARGLLRPIRLLQQDLGSRIQSLGKAQGNQPLEIVELETLRLEVDRLCRRLREAIQDRTVLLLGLSHELRGPLARLSLREPPGTDAAADLIEMREILDHFLTAAEVLGRPVSELVSAQAFVEQLVNRDQPSPRIQFHANGSGRRRLNRVALQRIANNLLDNALRHAPGASVRCSLNAGRDDWLLLVEDDGPGLPSVRREQPFAPLMPGPGGGLGLGLALCRLLAEQNGWQLSLDTAPMRGTRISLLLPGLEP